MVSPTRVSHSLLRLNCQTLRHQVEDLALVDELLLPVRDQPAFVLAIAREAAADMIPQAAQHHVVERGGGELHELRRAGAQEAAPHHVEQGDGREFLLRAGDAAEEDVEALADAQRGAVERARIDLAAHVAMPQIVELADDACSVAACTCSGCCGRCCSTSAQDGLERRRQAGALFLGEVGADDEGHALRIEEGGQRPAAAMAQKVGGRLVDLVDVGAFLAVDLHVDEMLVHERRGLGIGEALLLHDMAPVAGGVADGEKDRLARGLRCRQRLLAPGIPVDRIVLVGEQKGAGFTGEAVHGVFFRCAAMRPTGARPSCICWLDRGKLLAGVRAAHKRPELNGLSR